MTVATLARDGVTDPDPARTARMNAACRVLLVDDHPLVLAGLTECLSDTVDLCVVGTAANGEEAIEEAHAGRPDLALVDCTLPDMSGAELCAELTQLPVPPRVVGLTATDSGHVLTEFVRAGCSGLLVKDASPAGVLGALRTVAGGAVWFDPRALATLGWMAGSSPSEPLTPRELAALQQLASGRTYVEIAREMHVSKGTVKNVVSSLLIKLDAKRRSEAIAVAVRRGLL